MFAPLRVKNPRVVLGEAAAFVAYDITLHRFLHILNRPFSHKTFQFCNMTTHNERLNFVTLREFILCVIYVSKIQLESLENFCCCISFPVQEYSSKC